MRNFLINRFLNFLAREGNHFIFCFRGPGKRGTNVGIYGKGDFVVTMLCLLVDDVARKVGKSPVMLSMEITDAIKKVQDLRLRGTEADLPA